LQSSSAYATTVYLDGHLGKRSSVMAFSDAAFLRAASELAQYLINCYEHNKSPDLQREKLKIARLHGLARGLSTSEIIDAIPLSYRDRIVPYVRKKPVRTASGVAVIAFMCKPN
jgi:elongator complex protein 3